MGLIQIFIICALEIIVRSQKIYFYYMPLWTEMTKSISNNYMALLILNLLISSSLFDNFKSFIIFALIQILISIIAAIFCTLIVKVTLKLFVHFDDNNSKRSKIPTFNISNLSTKFEIWKFEWFNFANSLIVIFNIIGFVLASIYFKSAQFIIIGIALNLLYLKSSIYQIRPSEKCEVFGLKSTPFQIIIHDFLRLCIASIALILIAIWAAVFSKNWSYFWPTLIFIAVCDYLFFSALLYKNRFGNRLSNIALIGETLVLIIVATSILPILPAFAAFFIYQNLKQQPKGFYGIS